MREAVVTKKKKEPIKFSQVLQGTSSTFIIFFFPVQQENTVCVHIKLHC